MHTFNPNTKEANVVYRVNSRTVRATQTDPVSKATTKKESILFILIKTDGHWIIVAQIRSTNIDDFVTLCPFVQKRNNVLLTDSEN